MAQEVNGSKRPKQVKNPSPHRVLERHTRGGTGACVCVMCVCVCCVCVGGGGGGARDTESKTRTPHKDVGKNPEQILAPSRFKFSPLLTRVGGWDSSLRSSVI